jgi:2-isopropylmalate synthase
MNKDRVYIYDTTLRDGAQTIGTNFLLPDKLRIIEALDALGLDYIEAGFPGSNPVDTGLFDVAPQLKRAHLTAFGMTKRAGYSVSNDPTLQQVIRQAKGQICIVAKSSEYHVQLALGITNDENLGLIRDSLAAIRDAGHEAYLNCEHFFTGYLANPLYGQAVVRAALQSGARWITLCDTNGGTMPSEIDRIVREVCEVAPGDRLGIHAHNDTEQAVANSLAAISAGCRLVHGTMNGLGERCGNANLTSLIPTLLLKAEYAERFEIAVKPEDLARLTDISRMVDSVLGRVPFAQAPYVGSDAFATKAGLHASAIRKEPATYEHIDPVLVGNQRRVVVAGQAGRSNVLAVLERLNVPVLPDDDRVSAMVDQVKRDEAAGYAFDLGEASLDLRVLAGFGRPVALALTVQQITSQEVVNAGKLIPVVRLSLTASFRSDDQPVQVEASGSDAFDVICRAVLGFYPEQDEALAELSMTLLEQRTIDTGNANVFRAVVEGQGTAAAWRTVGVGHSPVAAIVKAVDDGLRYALTLGV